MEMQNMQDVAEDDIVIQAGPKLMIYNSTVQSRVGVPSACR
jgi:hypothetical protein